MEGAEGEGCGVVVVGDADMGGGAALCVGAFEEVGDDDGRDGDVPAYGAGAMGAMRFVEAEDEVVGAFGVFEGGDGHRGAACDGEWGPGVCRGV